MAFFCFCCGCLVRISGFAVSVDAGCGWYGLVCSYAFFCVVGIWLLRGSFSLSYLSEWVVDGVVVFLLLFGGFFFGFAWPVELCFVLGVVLCVGRCSGILWLCRICSFCFGFGCLFVEWSRFYGRFMGLSGSRAAAYVLVGRPIFSFCLSSLPVQFGLFVRVSVLFVVSALPRSAPVFLLAALGALSPIDNSRGASVPDLRLSACLAFCLESFCYAGGGGVPRFRYGSLWFLPFRALLPFCACFSLGSACHFDAPLWLFSLRLALLPSLPLFLLGPLPSSWSGFLHLRRRPARFRGLALSFCWTLFLLPPLVYLSLTPLLSPSYAALSLSTVGCRARQENAVTLAPALFSLKVFSLLRPRRPCCELRS